MSSPVSLRECINRLTAFKESLLEQGDSSIFRCRCPNCVLADLEYLGVHVPEGYRDSDEYKKIDAHYRRTLIETMKRVEAVIHKSKTVDLKDKSCEIKTKEIVKLSNDEHASD